MAFNPMALTLATAKRLFALRYNNTVVMDDPMNQWFFDINLVNDGSDDSIWPDRWMFKYNGKPVSWFNEYTELRVAPAKPSTIPFRIFSKIDDADEEHNPGVSLFEIVWNRNIRTNIYRITTEGDIEGVGDTAMDGTAHYGGRVTSDEEVVSGGPIITDGGLVFGTPIDQQTIIPDIKVLTDGDPLPGGTADGTWIFYLEA